MNISFKDLKRFLHWGPITAISIMECITMTTLYMNSMWWPPNGTVSGWLHQLFFSSLSILSKSHYVMATLFGPGYLPLEWKPKNPDDVQYLQYCKECNGYKAPRSHHCRKCNRCVKKMDHHCPWINNCVGWENHANFTGFLLFSILGSLHACVILSCTFYRGLYRYYYLAMGQTELATVNFTMFSIIFCILSMGLSVGVVIALSMLLYFQLKSIVSNQTGIEMWIVEKANYRREHLNVLPKKFIYPYDLGWKRNIMQCFRSAYLGQGDGVEWEVVEGCDQYTLTREQLAQKAEKRARTVTFKCIRPATGSIFPIISQGVRVCVAAPCTDEPRIYLNVDDIVRVTRFREHWLFGERDLREAEKLGEVKPASARRGWFPRRCVIEYVEPDFDNYEEEQAAITTVNGAVTKTKYSNGHKIRNGHKKKIT